jgi:hypothetical protein
MSEVDPTHRRSSAADVRPEQEPTMKIKTHVRAGDDKPPIIW